MMPLVTHHHHMPLSLLCAIFKDFLQCGKERKRMRERERKRERREREERERLLAVSDVLQHGMNWCK